MPTHDDDIEAYALRQEQIAADKEPDAPCSAEMHRKQAAYARLTKQFPRADCWPAFDKWCAEQWERE